MEDANYSLGHMASKNYRGSILQDNSLTTSVSVESINNVGDPDDDPFITLNVFR
jgi:hypothetical protein